MTETNLLSSYADANPGYELTTEEEACNWITEQIDALGKLRMGVNFVLPGPKHKTTEFRRSVYRKFLQKHGGVLGMLAVLYRCGRVTQQRYMDLRRDAMELLGPSLVLDRYDWYADIARSGLTEERAREWLTEHVGYLWAIREDCNVWFPNNPEKTKRYQEAAEMRLLVKLGCVLGMLVACHRCRLISDIGYNLIQQDAMSVMGPTIVGDVHGGQV